MRSLLALFLVFSIQAQAVPKRVWECQISAKLLGAGQHFLYYGRDAWNGTGSLYCESGPLNVYRTVAVSFNSLYDGFGADRNSVLQLIMSMETEMNPNELQIRSLVYDRNSGPEVKWMIESELNRADIYVTYATPSTAGRSLQRGTLFIRSSGE